MSNSGEALRKRVLFVDDEIAVLDGLQNLLRRERRRWDMVFALGADQALSALEKDDIDVVVSDMRMPGMDGAALLAKVKQRHPGTARIVLSGHAERDAVMRALAVAQQFLSKPCDADVLRSTIERTCELHNVLLDTRLRDIVGGIDRLPSEPKTYRALGEAMARPATCSEDIARIVETDPGMSVKILQLVNSAYFGTAQKIVSIPQAVSYLGMDLLQGLALAAQVFVIAPPDSEMGFSIESLQTAGLRCARLAKKFLADPKRAEEAFTAGLLHDVGRVILALGMPAEVAAVTREVTATARPLHVVEKEMLGVTHAEVGAYLLGVWGLPFSIVEAVAHHHHPEAVIAGPSDILAAVHVASALSAGETPDLSFIERAGFTAELPRWQAVAAQEKGR